MHEKLFIGTAWSTKGTVEAALATMVYDAASQNNNLL